MFLHYLVTSFLYIAPLCLYQLFYKPLCNAHDMCHDLLPKLPLYRLYIEPEHRSFCPRAQLVKDEVPKREKRHKDVEPIEQHPVTPIEKYIKVDPSPQPYPKTTAQNIGWRSTEPGLALDRYGKYAKPKGGLIKQLNWPTEAIS